MCISRNPGDISAVCSLSTWMFISRNHEDISAVCSLSRRDNKMFKRHSCCPFCPVFLMLSFLFQMHNARFPGLLILQTKVFYGNDNLEDTCVSTIYFVIYQLSIWSHQNMQWLVGLGVWFSLWVREVPGSNPGRALLFDSSVGCGIKKVPWPGFEPGLSRPQREVLTTILSRQMGKWG